MHLDLERLHRHVDGELAPDDRAEVFGHLTACAECAELVRRTQVSRDDLWRMLRVVDHPAPAVTAGEVIARARKQPLRRLRWAAGVVIALAVAGAAYATTGMPIRDWLRAVSGASRADPAPAGAVAPQSQRENRAGIAVDPGASLVIRFANAQSEGTLSVSLTDASQVTVRGAASFASAEDRLLVANTASSGDFEVELPREAPRVEIRVGGDRVLLKEDGRISATVAADSSGTFRIPMTGARP